MSQSQYVQSKISGLGSVAIKLQLVSQVLVSAPPKPRMTSRKGKSSAAATLAVEKLTPQDVGQLNQPSSEFAPEGGPEENRMATAMEIYKSELSARIYENKYYPGISRRLGQQGKVIVAFTLLQDGSIIDLRIVTPSSSEWLNKSAMDAVRKVERFKPIPVEIGKAKIDMMVPVEFNLI
ncbi:MAG TPA: energy transducer TonB [Bacteriovoracaceae bacterium]|nr:energy transducer TonB [Bacteriovoracaceae bacterium]